MATTTNPSPSLRDLLYRVKATPDEQLLAMMKSELDNIFKALDMPGINQDFRSDLLKIISSALDLVKTMSSSTYNIDDVLMQLSGTTTRISYILAHISASRPRTQGFGLVHRDNGKILPSIWLEETEASKYISSMRDMGALAHSVDILPVEIVSRYIPRPRPLEPVQNLEPPIADDPMPAILRETPQAQPFTIPEKQPIPSAPPAAIPPFKQVPKP